MTVLVGLLFNLRWSILRLTEQTLPHFFKSEKASGEVRFSEDLLQNF